MEPELEELEGDAGEPDLGAVGRLGRPPLTATEREYYRLLGAPLLNLSQIRRLRVLAQGLGPTERELEFLLDLPHLTPIQADRLEVVAERLGRPVQFFRLDLGMGEEWQQGRIPLADRDYPSGYAPSKLQRAKAARKGA